jgi:CheY-like chemotaxis protein
MVKRTKVMVVDDDKVHLAIVQAWLELDGFDVITRDSPFGTASVVLRERPTIILLDVEMPGLEGQALAGVIDKMPGKPGIIFYSGKERAALEALVRDHPVLGAIRKTNSSAQFLSEFHKLAALTQSLPHPRR